MKGFTLVEVLVSILILSFLFAAIVGVLNIGNMTYNIDLTLLGLQQQARLAIDGMTRELRQTKASKISSVSESEITFSIPPATYGSDWIGPIRYYFDTEDNRIIREYPTGTEKIVANDINSLNFALNNNLLNIQLTCARIVHQRDLSFSLTEQVRLRNE